MLWPEMEKKAHNCVVLRGNVDGNRAYTFYEELEAKEKKKEEKQFLHKGRSVSCAYM